jgi:hypothetical protein
VHILRDWIYSIPTWLSGSIIVFGAVATSLLALACFHRFVPAELRRAHNDVAGFILAIVGVIYAVLLAFIAVSTWEEFNKAQDSADLEADMVDNLYVDSAGLPPALSFLIQQRLREYSRIVVAREWPAQRAGRLSIEGWKPLYQLNTAISKFRSSEGTAAALDAEVGYHFTRRCTNSRFQFSFWSTRFSAATLNDRPFGRFINIGDCVNCSI